MSDAMKTMKICAACDGNICNGSRLDSQYCSNACRQRAYRERRRYFSSENIEKVIAAGNFEVNLPELAAMLRARVTDRSGGSRDAAVVS